MADSSETNNNPGEGTPDDFSTWDWHKIMTAIVGYYGNATDSGLSQPQTLKDAANTLEYVKNTLAMVAQSIREQSDALSYGDDAPWKGEAATAFNQMMYTLSQNIHANAQVLVGDVAADEIPNQIFRNGQRLEAAINTIHAIDHWYADQAKARGAHVRDGLVMVHEDQTVVDMMTKDMRTVITNLSNHYKVTNDGFTPPNTDDGGGPNTNDPFGNGNNDPFGNGNNDPFGNGNNDPFGNGNNDPFGGGNNDPFGGGDGSGGGGAGGGGDFTPPDIKQFPGGGDDGLGGGGGDGAGGGGGSDFSPPPASPFPGGGDGQGGDNLSAFEQPPASPFPGGDGLGGDGSGGGGLGGDGLGSGGLGGGSTFAPPPVSGFPGGLGGSLGGDSGGLNDNLSGLKNNSDLFNDTSAPDTSGLGADSFSPPPVEQFPGGGGVGGGLGDGAGGGLGGGGLGSNLAGNLAQDAPEQFPGLGDGLGGVNAGNQNQVGSSMPMSPGMGGMGGGMGQQNNQPAKSDASGLLSPTRFPGDLDSAFDPSTLLHGGDGASGGGGGLSGLDGLKGLDGLEGPDDHAGGPGSVSGFPGGTDVSDPSLAGVDGGAADLGGDQLLQAGGGPNAQAGPGGMPMSPGMGGMGGGMGQQNNQPAKSDASGLLNPTAFPGGASDYAGDPSVLISGGAGAAGGSAELFGLDLTPTSTDDVSPAVLPDDGTAVDNPDLPVAETVEQPQQQAFPGTPMMMPPVVPARQPEAGGHRPEASALLIPGHTPFAEGHGHHGGTEHDAVEPTPPVDRVAMVDGNDGAEDFTAWEVGGASSAAVLPWLFARGKGEDGQDLMTDAPVEDNDKWVQGDLRGVPGPAEQPQLATWRPEKVGAGGVTVPEEPELRSSFGPPPDSDGGDAPEVDEDAVDEEGEEPERTSADLLDRRCDQWDSRGSDLPGVLG